VCSNSHKEISYGNYAPKSMKSHKKISQQPKISMRIPLGNRIPKICSTKHEIVKLLGKNTGQSSLTGNASSNFMHEQLLSSLLNMSSIHPLHRPFLLIDLPLSCMSLHHLLAVKTKPPTILKQPCFGQGPKHTKSHKNISQRSKKHEITSGNLMRTSPFVTNHIRSYNRPCEYIQSLPHSSTPPLYITPTNITPTTLIPD
jgi:hypothetical protein